MQANVGAEAIIIQGGEKLEAEGRDAKQGTRLSPSLKRFNTDLHRMRDTSPNSRESTTIQRCHPLLNTT